MPAIVANQRSAFLCPEDTVLGCFFGIGRLNFTILLSSMSVPNPTRISDSMGMAGDDTHSSSTALLLDLGGLPGRYDSKARNATRRELRSPRTSWRPSRSGASHEPRFVMGSTLTCGIRCRCRGPRWLRCAPRAQTLFVQCSNDRVHHALGCHVAIVLEPRGGMKCDPFPIQSSD